MKYIELKNMWLNYLNERGHTIIPSAPVVPENDPTTLFITAGMQPLVPFLLGEHHPGGKRLANVQRCIRTTDIDEVGDNSHLTFFEMMGNWSLGDYFKKEKVAWSYEFLTSQKYLGLAADHIHVTCFEGNEVAPRDTECAGYWEAQGIPKDRIHFLPKSENWWALASGVGPQGPCSEMFFHDPDKCKCEKCECDPANNCGCFTELGNDVYMQYVVEKAGDKTQPAKQRNVDTGWGLERILCFVNGYKSVYESEIFAPAIKIIEDAMPKSVGSDFEDTDIQRRIRIIAEHTRAASIIISDGVIPSNTGAGYVLRRLIRRAVRMANMQKISDDVFRELIKFYNTYLEFNCTSVTEIFMNEVAKFKKTLANGLKEFEKITGSLSGKIDGKTAFHLYETYGFPIELTIEMAREHGFEVNIDEYNAAKAEHTKQSQTASAGVFKGGLADDGVETTKLHTCAHILLAVLREKFGPDITQKGANITAERLRFDFSFARRLEQSELDEIEKRVNEIISCCIAMTMQEMSVDEAHKIGATGSFGSKYGAVVKVYSLGQGKNRVSCEICGGPHVQNTKEIGTFKIQKEESVGGGIRRIRAVLQ